MSINDEIKFDKRIIERNIAKGIVTQAEVNKREKKLRDLTDESLPLEAELKAIGKELPSAPLDDEDEL
jgi:hypothetical protein